MVDERGFGVFEEFGWLNKAVLLLKLSLGEWMANGVNSIKAMHIGRLRR
jgi:hypothetical protein